MSSVTVTEVRNALRCPRLFALGRTKGSAVGFPVGSSCLGSTFHRIVERFSRDVQDPPGHFRRLPRDAARDDVEASLARWLLGLLVHELEADPTYSTMPAEVDDLAEALRELARHLAGRLLRFERPPTEALPRVVIASEQPIEARLCDFTPSVRGRIDALYGDHEGRREVIEYKLTDDSNDQLDRAQVALYRVLLREAAHIDARPVVLRFAPTLRETGIDPETAEGLVRNTLEPLLQSMVRWMAEPSLAPATERRDLCSTCPVVRGCVETYPERISARDDPPAGASQPRTADAGISASEPLRLSQPPPPPPDQEGRLDADRIAGWIVNELKREGIQVGLPHPAVVGPTVYVIELARTRGSVTKLDRAANDILHRLANAFQVEATYDKDSARRMFVVRRRSPRRVGLARLLGAKSDWLTARPGRYVVGERPEGDALCGDFGDAGTPHLLVAGQTGSGKSWFLLSVIASLIQFHGPESIRLTLVDPKRVTFGAPAFQAAVGSHLDDPIVHDIEEALPILGRLVEIMEERYLAFEHANVQCIDDFNAVDPAAVMERKIVVIDEFQDLTGDKDTSKTFFEIVRRLGSKARAAGIHLVLSTQRPDAQTIPPIIKSNLGGKVALKVASAVNSRIILDAAGAERLHGAGDLLADLGHGLLRAQAPWMG